MKIIIDQMGMDSKVLLDDGTDITKALRINAIEIKSRAGDKTKAILTVFPSEVITELENGKLAFNKHQSWELLKK
jgi:hypothetical protein